MAKHVGCSFQMVLYPTMTQHSKFNIAAMLQSFPRGTSAGPSGLRVQHLLDVVSIPLPSPLCISLNSVVNLLASGKVPFEVSRYLAGGNLTALKKIKPNSPPDIRQIAVGETLRKLTGKCLCDLVKEKASDFFQPLQLGVACASGTEKIVHGIRRCVEDQLQGLNPLRGNEFGTVDIVTNRSTKGIEVRSVESFH